ncbi:MAG: flagellar hook-basal body complex protein [Bacillota bacterium]|nr:flagellar hook-basal body complex protein [Bacillota bacterium]
MYRILGTGRSGLAALQEKLDLISNNVANSQTDGYKRLETNFESLLSDSIKNNGIPLSNIARQGNPSIGIGSKVSKPSRDTEQGAIVQSENPYAIAIEGEGYFGILNKEDNLYLARNGNFRLSEKGHLVDDLGNEVDAKYFYDEISSESILEITDSGQINKMDEYGNVSTVGQLKLYSIEDYDLLLENGNGYLVADEIESIDLENSKTILRQGYIEKSNVDIGEELIQMISTQRAYELNTKSLRAADEMWSLVNNMRR